MHLPASLSVSPMRTEDFSAVDKMFSLDGPSNVSQEVRKVEWSKGSF